MQNYLASCACQQTVFDVRSGKSLKSNFAAIETASLAVRNKDLLRRKNMKSFVKIFGLVLVAGSLVLAGCNKKASDEKKQDEKAATTAKADTAKPADDATKKADAKADEAKKAVADAVKAATAGNAKDAPEYMVKMVDHMKAMNKITKDNLADCKKVAEEVTKYVKAHEGEFKELQKQAEEAKKTMTPEDQKKMGPAVMALIGPVMQDMMSTQMQFQKKCPKEATALNTAMKELKFH